MIAKCAPSDTFDPTGTDCTSFESTGVRLTRVYHLTRDGRVTDTTDTWTSVDGHAHTLDVEYEHDLQGLTSAWELPGQAAFVQHTTGQTAGAPASAPGTIYGILDQTKTPSLTNPISSLTFGSAYSGIRFDNTLWSAYSGGEESALVDYHRTIPAGGSITIPWSYATGTSVAEVQGYALAAQDQFKPAAISITTPAPGKTVTSSALTVSGTASAGSGVAGVKVGGVAATVAGASWTAKVSLKPGADTLSATVTSKAGHTATVSERVTYRARPAGLTLKAKPQHDGKAPYRYKLSGRLELPTGAVRASACNGKVMITVEHGHKSLTTRQVSIGSSCTYSTKVSYSGKRLKGNGKLSIAARFLGNGELSARTASNVTVKFG